MEQNLLENSPPRPISSELRRMVREEAASPPRKRQRVLPFEKDDALWMLATVACRVAEEEEMRGKSVVDVLPDTGSCGCSGTPLAAEKGETSPPSVLQLADGASFKKSHPALEEPEEDGVRVLPTSLASTSAPHSAAVVSPRDEEMITTERMWLRAEKEGEVAAVATDAGCSTTPVPAADVAIRPKKNNRPYKRPRTGEHVPVGWLAMHVHLGGSHPQFVVEKKLTNTDLSAHHSRLLLATFDPLNPSSDGVDSLGKELVGGQPGGVPNHDLRLTLMDRWGREYDGANLRWWGSKRWIVIGGSAWLAVARHNALRVGDVVAVFLFRVKGRLVLVLSHD